MDLRHTSGRRRTWHCPCVAGSTKRVASLKVGSLPPLNAVCVRVRYATGNKLPLSSEYKLRLNHAV